MADTSKRGVFTGLSRDTFLLAAGSLFGDISTEMLYPVLPIYITQVLKDSPAIVGIVEGIATAVQYIVQGVSGWFADRFQRKKPIALFGYALSAFAKPFIGLSTAWHQVLAARFTDRLGAGTRSAPRDALIAGSADERSRGKAFGLEGIGDNLGAFFGPLIAVGLLYFLRVDLRAVFYYALIPGLLAFVMVLFVGEQRIRKSGATTLRFSFREFPASYWKYIAVTALFGLGNSSNSFLILRARNIGIPLETTILIYAGFNLVAALSSYPSGALSDRWGRKSLLLTSFAVYALTYLGFALNNSSAPVLAVLFLAYGIFGGMFRTVGKALATDQIPPQLRATSIGIYSTTVGLSGLLANLIGGQLWVSASPAATFYAGAACAVAGTIGGWLLISGRHTASHVRG